MRNTPHTLRIRARDDKTTQQISDRASVLSFFMPFFMLLNGAFFFLRIISPNFKEISKKI